MHTWWITLVCCLPLSISLASFHDYPHFPGLWDFQNKIRCLWDIQGKYREMDAFGRVFVLLCFPCMSTGHVLVAVKAWPPDVQKFLTKVQCLFFPLFSLPKPTFQLETDATAWESQTYGSFTFCRQETLRGPKVIHQAGAKARVTTHISWPLRQC